MTDGVQECRQSWPFLQGTVFFQQFHEIVHQFLAAGTHVSLESLDGAMSGKRHDVIHRVAALIEIRDAATAGCMKTDHAPFGTGLDLYRSTAMLLVADVLVNTASTGQLFDGFIGFADVYRREAVALIIGYQGSYFLQDWDFYLLFRLSLV